MAASLFQTTEEPTLVENPEEVPKPGPNAFEVGVISYDPDQQLVVLSLPNEIQATFQIGALPADGGRFTLLLEDTKLGPRIEFCVVPRQPLPKFATPEEADAWLEANSR